MKTIKNGTITDNSMFSIIELLKNETDGEIDFLNWLETEADKESELLKETEENLRSLLNVLNEFIDNFKDKNKIEIRLVINGEEKAAITSK